MLHQSLLPQWILILYTLLLHRMCELEEGKLIAGRPNCWEMGRLWQGNRSTWSNSQLAIISHSVEHTMCMHGVCGPEVVMWWVLSRAYKRRRGHAPCVHNMNGMAKLKTGRQDMLNLDSAHCACQVTHVETCTGCTRTLVAISLIRKLLFITPVLNFSMYAVHALFLVYKWCVWWCLLKINVCYVCVSKCSLEGLISPDYCPWEWP